MVDNQALRSMALGAMTVVAVSILTATTLLPALLSLVGRRAAAPGRIAAVGAAVGARLTGRRGTTPDAANARSAFWAQWSARVMRRPILSVAGAIRT